MHKLRHKFLTSKLLPFKTRMAKKTVVKIPTKTRKRLSFYSLDRESGSVI